jgi:hypothetical protein
VIATTCDWDWNKRVNNPNGVFSGVICTTGAQNWSGTPNIVKYYSKLMQQVVTPQSGIGVADTYHLGIILVLFRYLNLEDLTAYRLVIYGTR